MDTLPDAETIDLSSNEENTMNKSNIEDFDVLYVEDIPKIKSKLELAV